MHTGVGLIITNKAKDLFFIQRKDSNYPIQKWANCYSFWGGAIEDSDNSEIDALLREVKEELDININSNAITYIDDYLIKSDHDFKFYLFEIMMADGDLQELKSAEVNEGEGVMLDKNDLYNVDWIWGLEHVVKEYLNRY